MIDQQRKVLVTGFDRSEFEMLAPVLQRSEFHVDRVSTPEAGIAMASAVQFEVIILDGKLDLRALLAVVQVLRSRRSPSRSAAILVLTDPERLGKAQNLIGQGVNRVMLVSDPPQMISQQVSSLLQVAPRRSARLPTRLDANIGSGTSRAFCQTVNLSESGMLLRTQLCVAVGEEVAFEIQLGEKESPISGRGEVVRHAKPANEGVDGIGVRFTDFKGDGEDRLRVFLGGFGD
ncbi:MAG: PilZ domain-containing protein [Thermoanaerobaculales bacterium]